MTKYRVQKDGNGKEWLEYKGWIFWKDVPKPHYDLCSGTDYWDKNLGRITNGFDRFVKEYPDISVYLHEVYWPKMFELMDEAKRYWDDHYKRKYTITTIKEWE